MRVLDELRPWVTASAPLAAGALVLWVALGSGNDPSKSGTTALRRSAGAVAGRAATHAGRAEKQATAGKSGASLQRARACPAGMVLVSGQHCPEVEHRCDDWLDDPKLPFARCKRYHPRAVCKSERITLRFCIDRDEYAEAPGSLPQNYQSLARANEVCRAAGKRLCREREWNFACEGEEMLPYPYGWSREPKCNQDRSDLIEVREGRQVLRDLRAAAGTHPLCVSPFGARDMVGNLDEPVLRDGTHFAPWRTALKGGWWMAGRNRCRPATTAHDDYYRGIQVGIRCCSEASPE